MNILLFISHIFTRRSFLVAMIPLDRINNKTVLSPDPIGMVTSCYFDFKTNGWVPFEYNFI